MLDRPAGRSLGRLLAPLNRTPLVAEQQLVLAAQVAVWVWLADSARIPAELAPVKERLSGEEVSRVFRELRGLDGLGGNADAFIADDSVIHAVPEVALLGLVEEARHQVAGGFIGAEFIDELLLTLGATPRGDLPSMPAELTRLLIGLADIHPGDQVYTPFDDALQLSLAAALAGGHVFTETPRYSPLPYLINLLTEQQIHVMAGRNPITNPGFTDGQRLRIFDRTVSFPPMGWRLPMETSDRDLYGRFRERTTSGTVLVVRHIMAQTGRRAVVLVANSLLFGAGAERAVREDLAHGGLEAVVALPPALLLGTTIPLAVLVINLQPTINQAEVLLVDGAAERFHKRDGKGRTTLTGWQELLETVRARRAGDAATLVSLADLAANDYQLMVSRYARSPVDAALRAGEVMPLEDLVEFIRPVPINASDAQADNAAQALEVGVADLPEFGYISDPKKRVQLASLRNELQPLDILIAVKGSVGKVGIVPPGLDAPWVAGQSCLVLRLKQPARRHPHSPHSLLLYLRSKLGQACLSRITSGAAVPLIQLRELRKLPVLIPPTQEQAAADHAFKELVELQQQIEGMRAQQKQLASSFWALPETEMAEA